ncbi:hypothetical protein [Acinetobacter kyonggiensis]|uniref:Uncharacterized protein n=1 Tax=Acinetobacter kyonggiensis TaxID=595670 RepID=A0A1H3FP49_9GAMM|nr:hypothetical protein [Acinetobacter kyonggiensis]SDX92690.1 hypothetical protein SAMN05421643_101217 [Acinetobacter kyonggiensis]
MKLMKTALLSSVILTSTCLFIQTTSAAETTPATKTAPAYGDNPNIFKVLGYKAQQAAQNTADKVDHAAQKGIAKVKPKVDNAWEESKVRATETSVLAKEKSQQAAATVNKKINETKDAVIGSPNTQPAPIISHPLSQSSSSIESVPAPTPTTEAPQTPSKGSINL